MPCMIHITALQIAYNLQTSIKRRMIFYNTSLYALTHFQKYLAKDNIKKKSLLSYQNVDL